MDVFTLRRRVRDALRNLEAGEEVHEELRALHAAHASGVEDALDASETQDPGTVARARAALGLVSTQSAEAASRILDVWQRASGFEACQLAVDVIGADARLSGVARALLDDVSPAAGGVLALARSLAPNAGQRRALAVALARRQMRGGVVDERWVIRREGVRLLGACERDGVVLAAWREVPGHGVLVRFTVDQGLELIEPTNEKDATSALEDFGGSGLDLGALRSTWASSIQPTAISGEANSLFASLVDARLFPNAGGGHAVGTPYASMLLETLAGAVQDGTLSPADLVWPGSEAEAFLDLYGLKGLTRLLLLDRGAGELLAKLEHGANSVSGSGWIESTPPGSGTASRLVLTARVEDDVWWLTRFELADPAPALAAARWNGDALIPIQDYDGLDEDEQELVAGMADGGVSLGMIACALSSLRSRSRVTGTPELRAAYTHAEALSGYSEPFPFGLVADAYGVDAPALKAYARELGLGGPLG